MSGDAPNIAPVRQFLTHCSTAQFENVVNNLQRTASQPSSLIEYEADELDDILGECHNPTRARDHFLRWTMSSNDRIKLVVNTISPSEHEDTKAASEPNVSEQDTDKPHTTLVCSTCGEIRMYPEGTYVMCRCAKARHHAAFPPIPAKQDPVPVPAPKETTQICMMNREALRKELESISKEKTMRPNTHARVIPWGINIAAVDGVWTCRMCGMPVGIHT